MRETWAALVYLALEIAEPLGTEGEEPADGEAAGAVHPGQTVGEARRAEYVPFAQAVAGRVREGASLQELSLDGIAPAPAGEARTAMRTAVLSQSMRLVYLTFKVLEEEEEAAGKKVARPFIPGTGPKRGDGQPAW